MNKKWMSREEWEKLVKGEGCPLCETLVQAETDNRRNFNIAEFGLSRLWLSANQVVPGYSVLVCHKHVREPFELSSKERIMYFEDLMLAGEALELAYHADKMNFEILGNTVPHLHCHIIPRYYGDPYPDGPVPLPFSETILLNPEQYQEKVALIRSVLDELQSRVETK